MHHEMPEFVPEREPHSIGRLIFIEIMIGARPGTITVTPLTAVPPSGE
jgi:hypothetical protein